MIHKTTPIKKIFKLSAAIFLFDSAKVLIIISMLTLVVQYIFNILILEIENFGANGGIEKLSKIGWILFFAPYVIMIIGDIKLYFQLKNSVYNFNDENIDKIISLRFSNSRQYAQYQNIQEIIITQNFIEKRFKVKNMRCRLSTTASSINFVFLDENDAEELFEKLKIKIEEKTKS